MARKKKILDEESKALIVNQYLNGISKDSIRRETGISLRQINRVISEAGIPSKYKGKTDPDVITKAINDFVNGMKVALISEKYNISDTTLYKELNKRGVTYRSEKGRKHHFDQRYFNVINTEEKAYWLGFLYADGCVTHSNKTDKKPNRVKINLSSKDHEHLIAFCDAIKYTGKIEMINPIGTFSTNSISRLAVNSTSMCEDLIALGCHQSKTFSITMPNIPNHLIRHFIRGYFDGDGSISGTRELAKFSIIGPTKMLEELQTVFINECNFSKNKIFQSKTPGISYLAYGGINKLRAIYHFLYDDSTVYLNRKKTKFESIISD